MKILDDKHPRSPMEFYLNCLGSEAKPKQSLIEKVKNFFKKMIASLFTESF